MNIQLSLGNSNPRKPQGSIYIASLYLFSPLASYLFNDLKDGAHLTMNYVFFLYGNTPLVLDLHERVDSKFGLERRVLIKQVVKSICLFDYISENVGIARRWG